MTKAASEQFYGKIGAYMVPGEPEGYAWRIDAYLQEGVIVLMPCSYRIKKDCSFAKALPLAVTIDDLRQAKKMSYEVLAEKEKKELVHFFLARDNRDECTFAEVYALDKGLHPEVSFMETLRLAVTNWVTTKEEGKALFESTRGDLNIGDLKEAVEKYLNLRWTLVDFGISCLSIETHTDDGRGASPWASTPYTYDTHLVKKDKREFSGFLTKAPVVAPATGFMKEEKK